MQIDLAVATPGKDKNHDAHSSEARFGFACDLDLSKP
jgi:hypothetical protein